MTKNKGLGRGLDALFGGAGLQENMPNAATQNLPVRSLRPNPYQPRKNFDEAALQELAASIGQQGIMQPLLARPSAGGGYEIVAGERRWRAAQLAGLDVVPVFIRNLGDDDVMVAALIENLQREDLNPIEEAEALQKLRDAHAMTQEELAERLGKSRSAIANALRLLRLTPAAREDIQKGLISAGHARCLLAVEDEGAMEALRCRILSHNLTVRDAEEAAASWREKGVLPWKDEEPRQVESRGRKRQSSEIKAWQKRLGATLGCAAYISGDAEKGRIALKYSTRGELERLLEKLGVAQ